MLNVWLSTPPSAAAIVTHRWVQGSHTGRLLPLNIWVLIPEPPLTALFHFLSQDTNVKGRFGRTFLIQRSCVPLSLVYRPAQLHGCPQDVNPQLHYYPAARRCSCSRCNMRSHLCVRTRRVSYEGCASATRSKGSKKKRT